MTPTFAEPRIAVGGCANCFIQQGEVVWGGPEPDYRWLCINCGEPYAKRRAFLKPGQVPPETDVVPVGHARYPAAPA